MRRKDREITDFQEMIAIMERCDVCRIALHDGDYPYMLPLSFGLDVQEEQVFLYFHAASEGKKLDLIARDNRAAFEMDCGHEWVVGEKAQETTSRFQCVMGGGPVTFLETEEEKRAGLTAILAHVTGRDQWDIGGAANTQVFRLDVEELSCKVHP